MAPAPESPREPASARATGDSPRYPAPELLARLVVRCRELETFLQAAHGHLPKPEETPFLFRQLEDVVARLRHGLALLDLPGSPEPREERGGFLRLFGGGKKRKTPSSPYPQARLLAKARYDLQGSAWTIPVTELVGFLSQVGKSGVLWVTTTSETFVLEFTRGNLVHATSNAPPRAFRLGEILVREEVLDRETLDREIARARSSEEFLGSHLVRSGAVSREQLQRALAIQVQELFHRLMDAENATYGFQDGLQLLRAQSLEVNITQLLLESARKKDEARLRAQGKAPPPPLAIYEPEGAEESAPAASAPAAPERDSAPVTTSAGEDDAIPEGWERVEVGPEPVPSASAEGTGDRRPDASEASTPGETVANAGEAAAVVEEAGTAPDEDRGETKTEDASGQPGDGPPAALPAARAKEAAAEAETVRERSSSES